MKRTKQGDQRRFDPLTESQKLLVEQHINLARWYAKRVMRDEESFDELLSAACDGLVRAAQTYNAKVGRFTTYATRWMMSRVQDYRRSLLPLVEMHHDCASNLKIVDHRPVEVSFSDDVFNRLVRSLPKRQIRILRMLYVDGHNLSSVGKQIGLSKERIRSIRNEALEKIRVEAEKMELSEI